MMKLKHIKASLAIFSGLFCILGTILFVIYKDTDNSYTPPSAPTVVEDRMTPNNGTTRSLSVSFTAPDGTESIRRQCGFRRNSTLGLITTSDANVAETTGSYSFVGVRSAGNTLSEGQSTFAHTLDTPSGCGFDFYICVRGAGDCIIGAPQADEDT